MFDIGFWEIVLISVIGLVVLGPERLPIAIRTVRGWIGGVRNFSDTVKSELKEELRIHELHSDLKQAEQQNMSNLSSDVATSIQSLKEAAALVTRPYEKKQTTKTENNIALNSDNVITQPPDSIAPLTESTVGSKKINEQDDNTH